jgi:hypothetical protein
MHILIIIILVCLLFPVAGRLITGFFEGTFRVLLVLAAFLGFGALSH